MSFYQVGSSGLRSGRNELLSLNERFKNEKESLSSIELNLKNMWEGEANDQFHRAFMGDASSMDAFYGLIGRYCEAIEVIADRYDAAEQRNLAIAERSRI